MYKIEIFPEKALVIMEYSGSVDFQEIMKANTEMASDPRFKPSFNGVVDHRKANVELSYEEIQQIANSVSENNISVGRWVIMVESPKETAFSMLYKESIEDQHPEFICSTITGASAFLNVDLTNYLEAGTND